MSSTKKTPLPSSLSSARRLLRRDKRWLSFGFFLLVSSVLWTINKLSYSYTYDLPAQLEVVTTNPVNYVISANSVTQAELRVRARGYDLMRYNLFNSKTFKIPFTPTESSADNTSSVATAQLRNSVAQLLGTDYELQVITPDSINFKVSRIISKKVPVRSNFRITYSPQYMQRGATQLNPDSVVISGGESYVNEVNEIRTEVLTKNGVSAELSGKVNLIAPPQLFISHNKASYNIDVQRFIEISYSLPIHVVGVPDTLNVDLLPAKAIVTFSVTMEEYQQLKREELYTVANYSELGQSMSYQLPVRLSSPPTYVLSTRITPAFVEVISTHK